MANAPNFIDCLSTWLRTNHPNWEVISHVNDNWGDGVFIHFTKDHRVGYDPIGPHFAVLETSVLDCCGADFDKMAKYNMADPDFFEKLSVLMAREEEAIC